MIKKTVKITAATAFSLALLTAVDASAEDWGFSLGIYGYFPDLSGRTSFPTANPEGFEIGIDSILDNLDFTFQGNFDARNGRWGIMTDVIYLDIGNGRTQYTQGSVGDMSIPAEARASVDLDIKTLLWTTTAYYRLIDETDHSLDFMFGVRYADMEQTLTWNLEGSVGSIPLPARSGSSEIGEDFLDAIVGLRGHAAFGDGGWFMPYYADIGTGDSDLTWQAALGVGYEFDWGELKAGWRYLSYDLPSDGAIEELEMSGPQLGARWRW